MSNRCKKFTLLTSTGVKADKHQCKHIAFQTQSLQAPGECKKHGQTHENSTISSDELFRGGMYYAFVQDEWTFNLEI